MDGALEYFSEDTVYHVPGDNIISGDYHGRKELADFFIRLGELTEGSFKVEADEVLADDDYAALFWRTWASRGDRTLEGVGAMGFKFDTNGQFSESWFLYNDQDAYNAFYR